MENFSSFDEAAADLARRQALLKACASDSDESSSESEGERGGESATSSSSDDNDRVDERGKKPGKASTSEQRGRIAAKEEEKKKKKRRKERKSRTKKKAKEKESKKEKKKKKRRLSSRSRSRSPPQPPPLSRKTLCLPRPAPYAPSLSLPDPSSFSTVQEHVAALDDSIIANRGTDEGQEDEQRERIASSVRLLLAAGHAEAAAARVAAAAEFYFLAPEGLKNRGSFSSHDALLEGFERFWESGAALACEEEGEGAGWRGWFESGCLPLPPPLPVSSSSCSKNAVISREDAGLAARVASEVDARVAGLLPEGDATLPASLASRWARDERRAASLAWRPLRGPAAVAALAALSPEEAEGDPVLASAFAPFASVRSAVSFTRDAGVAAAAVKEMLSALGADVLGGGDGEEVDGRWCLASGERRRFLSRLLSSLVSFSYSSSSSLLADDAEVCWAALEIEAAVARGEEKGGEEKGGEEKRQGNENRPRNCRRDWPRARAKAKALLASAAAQGDAAAGLWRAYARLQAVSGPSRSSSSPSSLRVTEALLAALASQPEKKAAAMRHALAAAVEAADNVAAGGLNDSKNTVAVLLVAAACGVAPADVAVESGGGGPAKEARAAALSSLEKGAAVAASEGEAAAVAVAAAAAAAEALLLLLPRPASALAEAEAVAGLAQAADRLFGSSDAPSSSSSRQHHRRRHHRAFEWVVLRRCRLLATSAAAAATAAAATAAAASPSASASASAAASAAVAAAAAREEAARSAVLEALERFPGSAELVDLLADLPSPEAACAGADKKNLQLLRDVISRAPSPPALLRALSRASLSGTVAAASAIEHVLRSEGALRAPSSPQTPPQTPPPLLFRALARAEIAAAASGEGGAATLPVAASRARRALLRGLAACPWSLELFLDLVDPAALAVGCNGDEVGETAGSLLIVPSGERAQLLGAAADAGVLLGARVDVYETALAVAAEGIVVGDEGEGREENV